MKPLLSNLHYDNQTFPSQSSRWLLIRLFFIIFLVVLRMADKKDLIFTLTIFISKITLRVRFPCTICCALKTGIIKEKIDGTEREISGEGELNNG
jgi:hypothetical protein